MVRRIFRGVEEEGAEGGILLCGRKVICALSALAGPLALALVNPLARALLFINAPLYRRYLRRLSFRLSSKYYVIPPGEKHGEVEIIYTRQKEREIEREEERACRSNVLEE